VITVSFTSKTTAEKVIEALRTRKDLEDSKITTWDLIPNKKGLTHIGDEDQWKNEAVVFFPTAAAECKFDVRLYFKTAKDQPYLSAVYHGRFTQMLWAHFHGSITRIVTDKSHNFSYRGDDEKAAYDAFLKSNGLA
jgi:hypothetical protein